MGKQKECSKSKGGGMRQGGTLVSFHHGIQSGR